MLSVHLLPVFCSHLTLTPATMASLATANRKINCHFTANKILILEESMAVEENRKIMTSKFSESNSNEMKRLRWEQIAAKCSLTGPITRTGQEVRDKWQSMKNYAKTD